MPTVREIEQALFRLAPKEGAMDWDNVGQLLGDPEAEVRRVLVALDITEAVADEAIAENCLEFYLPLALIGILLIAAGQIVISKNTRYHQ